MLRHIEIFLMRGTSCINEWIWRCKEGYLDYQNLVRLWPRDLKWYHKQCWKTIFVDSYINVQAHLTLLPCHSFLHLPIYMWLHKVHCNQHTTSLISHLQPTFVSAHSILLFGLGFKNMGPAILSFPFWLLSTLIGR